MPSKIKSIADQTCKERSELCYPLDSIKNYGISRKARWSDHFSARSRSKCQNPLSIMATHRSFAGVLALVIFSIGGLSCTRPNDDSGNSLPTTRPPADDRSDLTRSHDPPQPAGPVPQTTSPAAELLFDGQSLQKWRIADEHEFSGHGEVAVRDGAIHLASGSPASGVVYTNQPPTVHYELSLEAMRTDGGDFFCGLTFPVRQSFCTLIVGGWGGTAVGLSNIDDRPADDNETTRFMEFEDGRWYAIRLRVTDETVSAWIDGERLFELKTEGRRFGIWWEQEPMRPLGIATWYTGAAIRDIRLTRLAGQAGPGNEE